MTVWKSVEISALVESIFYTPFKYPFKCSTALIGRS